MRVLAIDASLRSSGVAVVESERGRSRALYFGTIANKNTLASSACLVAIREELSDLIAQHEPDCCAMEAVIYVQSHKTAILLGAARGAAMLAAAERGLPIFEYAPTRIKQATVGRGSADKSQVALMMRALLGLTETPQVDEADALAIALTHVHAAEAARVGLPAGVRI
jgi:crossover junction endodeoxyribonuclease RuvC